MSGGGIAGILMIFLLVIVLFIAASCVKIVPQASAYVVESLGKYKGTWATGLHFKVPFIERVAIRVNLKSRWWISRRSRSLQKITLRCRLIRSYFPDYRSEAVRIRCCKSADGH